MGIDQDFFWGTMLKQCLIDLSDGSSLGCPSVEFSIRKCACSAFTEGVIGILQNPPVFEYGS